MYIWFLPKNVLLSFRNSSSYFPHSTFVAVFNYEIKFCLSVVFSLSWIYKTVILPCRWGEWCTQQGALWASGKMMLMSACPESDLSSAFPHIHTMLKLPAIVMKAKNCLLSSLQNLWEFVSKFYTELVFFLPQTSHWYGVQSTSWKI